MLTIAARAGRAADLRLHAFELETFVEGNYVACAPAAAALLPAVPWWKSG